MKTVISKQNVQEASSASVLKAEEVAKKSSDHIEAVNVTLKKGLIEDNGTSLNSNVYKLFKEVEKQTKIIKENKDKAPTIGAAKAEDITKKSMGLEQFKTIGERMSDFGKGFKDFFTVKGFLNKTGIVDKDSTGIVGTAVNRRAAKKQYAEDRMKVDPNYLNLAKGSTEKEKKANARKTFENQFDKQQEIKKQQRQNEGEISSLQKSGYTEQQIKRSGLLKTREGLAEKLTAVDSRVRDNAGSGNTKKDLEVESKKKQKTTDTIKEAMEFSDEGQIEAQRNSETQTALLAKIEENTRSERSAAKEPKAESESGGGLLDTIMGFLGPGFMTAIKSLFSPKNLLKAFTKFLAPALIIGALINGIMDGFNKFMETGDIGEALIAGLGGILSFLTFGLFDADTISSLVDWFSSFVTDFIIQPVKDFFGFLGDSFDKYIAQPIMGAFSSIKDIMGTLLDAYLWLPRKILGLIDEYIVTPLKEVFAPVTDFFKKIKDQIFGFLEDFGIPEIGFTIPIIGKKVSIGPFYPFRPNEGTARVGTSSGLSQTSSASGETETFRNSVVSTEKGASSVLVNNEKSSTNAKGESKSEISGSFARFDVKTGKALYEPGAGGEAVDISASTFRKVKSAARDGADTAKLDEIVKEDKAYEQLSFWDKRKVDVGYVKASDLLAAQQGTGKSDVVYNKSSDNAAAAAAPPPAMAPVVVNAPTNVSNSRQNIAMPQAIRNPDNGFNKYAGSRAVML